MKPISPARSTLSSVATKKKKGGRVTPKGGHPQPSRIQRSDDDSVESSSRYTPPIPGYKKQSPQWMLYLLFGLLGFGVIVIFFYYLGFVPGGRSNWYLAVGLASLLGGLYTATKYH